jgi:hypothetical protein
MITHHNKMLDGVTPRAGTQPFRVRARAVPEIADGGREERV